jgi:ribosome biogenesis GTPase
MEEQTGRILRVDAKQCIVDQEGQTIAIPLAGKLFKKKNRSKRPVAVGDLVRISRDPNGERRIEEVLPRKNRLARASAGEGKREQVLVANIDQCLLVSSLRHPPFRPRLVDRILTGCERDHIPAVLILNKLDLEQNHQGDPASAPFDSAAKIKTFYEALGYPTLSVSAESGEGIDAFRNLLKNKVSVVTGLSGVGKSSLLNAVEPGLSLHTSEISEKHREGRHTTTSSSLIPLSFGGHVVDTPGIRNFAHFRLDPRELANLFPEFREACLHCAFVNCSHTHEPKCGIKSALDEGYIAPSRYASFLELLGEAK